MEATSFLRLKAFLNAIKEAQLVNFMATVVYCGTLIVAV